MELIDKDAALAEIYRLRDFANDHWDVEEVNGVDKLLDKFVPFINALEVIEAGTWHLQEKEDIYDAVKDWSLYKFVCIMKDGTIQMFTGCMDEDCEGHINVHINGLNADYDNVDDIIKWIELT